MLYAPRACTAPPVHSVTQSICYIYIIITTSCWCCKCYTRFALRASLAAAVSYNIPYTCTHTGSYRITYYPAHTHAIGSTHTYTTPKHNS